MNIDLKTLKDMSLEELKSLRDDVVGSRAGSFMGAVKKQYYLEAIDSVLSRMNNKELEQ